MDKPYPKHLEMPSSYLVLHLRDDERVHPDYQGQESREGVSSRLLPAPCGSPPVKPEPTVQFTLAHGLSFSEVSQASLKAHDVL